MQPSEALGVVAQVAIALAGFAGIVVVFRPGSVHQWSPLDRFRLHLLLTNSALPLIESLFGLLMLSIEPPVPGIWRWCSSVGFAAQLVVIVFVGNPKRKVGHIDLRQINKFIYYGIALLGTSAMALQAINFSLLNRFWPFFALIFVHLIAALAQFLRMVLLPPHTSD